MFQRGNLNMGSGSVGEVPTIFHPRRSRAPSIVLSEDQQNHGPIASPIQVVLDSTGCEQQQGCSVAGGCGDSASSCRSLETSGSGVGSGTGGTGIATGSTGGPGGGGGQGHGSLSQTQSTCNVTTPSVAYQQSRPNKLSACYASCCAESAKKIYFGVCVTICVTASWVGATHCIKYLYFHKPTSPSYTSTSNASVTEPRHQHVIRHGASIL